MCGDFFQLPPVEKDKKDVIFCFEVQREIEKFPGKIILLGKIVASNDSTLY
jgi:hypothetical protein